MQEKPPAAVQTFWEAEAAGNTADVDVDWHQLIHSVLGDSLPGVPLPDVPPPDVPLTHVPRPEAHPDRSVGYE